MVCAFSGSHQDAIKKGFQARKDEARTVEDEWQLPYLPLDPQDIGRTYEAIIRVNSQSGKGGAAWIILRKLELDLPRGLQIEFSKVVQKQADDMGRELLSAEIADLFEKTYFLRENPRFNIVDYSISVDRSTSPLPPMPGKTQDTKNLGRLFEGVLAIDGNEYNLRGRGNGPISSLANALKTVGIDLDVADYKEHAIGGGREVKAATYIECISSSTSQKVWGVGIHEDVVQSSLIALLGAATSFMMSRPGSPVVTKPPQGSVGHDLDLNGTSKTPAPAKLNGSVVSHGAPSDLVQALEAKANSIEMEVGR